MRYLLVLVIILQCCLTGCFTSKQNKQLILDYQSADSLKPNIVIPEKNITQTPIKLEWQEIIKTPDKQIVSLRASDYPLSYVNCIYDGITTYKVYEYCDYMSVNDLRLSSDRRILYVYIKGLHSKISFNWDENWLYVFDLEKRKHLHRIKVKDL